MLDHDNNTLSMTPASLELSPCSCFFSWCLDVLVTSGLLRLAPAPENTDSESGERGLASLR